MSEMLPFLLAVCAGMLRAATPLGLAAVGELVYQRSGVLNLSTEGLILVGACTSVAAQLSGCSVLLAVAVAVLAGAFFAMVHAFFVITLRTNQAITGLSMLFLLQGLTAVAGRDFVGRPIEAGSSRILLTAQSMPVDPLFVVFVAACIGVYYFLFQTNAGIALRACGENAAAAIALGLPIQRIRMVSAIFCGAMCGLAGSQLAIFYTQQWQEGMVAGRGWIALVLVFFVRWRPIWLIWGSCFFGGLAALQLNLQAYGWGAHQYLLAMCPFWATIAVLVVTSIRHKDSDRGMPSELGRHLPFTN